MHAFDDPCHRIGHTSSDHVSIIPWTQRGEDFLKAAVAAVDGMHDRVRSFFASAELEKVIQTADLVKLLPPAS